MIRLLTLLLMLLGSFQAAAKTQTKAPACKAPEPVCAQKSRVFRIASFDPQASAVLIEPGLLVTNRHVVADAKQAQVFSHSGKIMTVDVVPTSYAGDLILLKAPSLKATGSMATASTLSGASLYSIGTDTGRGRIRVYPPGRVRLLPAKDKPLARLHHDALSQPGNSGGALVNREGRLVAIIASGGEGRFEAIPAAEIARLKVLSGPSHRKASEIIGKAVRLCWEALEAARAPRRRGGGGDDGLEVIRETCPATQNRQFLDLAGQVLGRRGLFDEAVEIFAEALNQDPNAINSMVSMAVTLHILGRYKDEIPHLRRLLSIIPKDAQVLRLSVQAGVWGNDRELARTALKLFERHHPNMATAAENFIENDPPPPRKRKEGRQPR